MCLYHYRILELIFDRKRQPKHDETLRDIQPVGEPPMEPLPSEMRCKREILNIIGLQMTSGDTFLALPS